MTSRPIRWRVGLVWLAATLGPSAAAGNLPGGLERQLKTETLSPIATVAELPEAVRVCLTELFRWPTLKMADPGDEWQETDVVETPDLPIRRLILAGCSAEHCLIHYERGGIAHTRSVLLLELDDTGAHLIRGWSAPSSLGSVEEVREAVLSGKLPEKESAW
jgi:hypothetical protein